MVAQSQLIDGVALLTLSILHLVCLYMCSIDLYHYGSCGCVHEQCIRQCHQIAIFNHDIASVTNMKFAYLGGRNDFAHFMHFL